MNHTKILNKIIQNHRYSSYLEIGVQNPENNFNLISCRKKTGVDPEAHHRFYDGVFYQMGSNAFFRTFSGTGLYDIVFIDGMHHWEQVVVDFINSLQNLTGGGTIVMHDCLPSNEEMQSIPRMTKEWTGDTWKAFWFLGFHMKNYFEQVRLIEADYGCGIFENFIGCDNEILPIWSQISGLNQFIEKEDEKR